MAVACSGGGPLLVNPEATPPDSVESAASPTSGPGSVTNPVTGLSSAATKPDSVTPQSKDPVGISLPSTTAQAQPTTPGNAQPEAFYAYTHHRSDGNRLVSGRGSLPNATPLDIPLTGTPRWLVAAPFAGGILWVVVLKDGLVQAFLVVGNAVTEQTVSPNQLPPGMPPVLKVQNGQAELLVPPGPAASSLTPPAILEPDGGTVYLRDEGDLVVSGDAEARLSIDALPDARLLTDDDDRMLILTGPTTIYPDGVLGDDIEAGGFTLVRAAPELTIESAVELTGEVIEGISAIWTDLNGDGTREIIVTASNADRGARLLVFDERGNQIAAGQAVGRGSRWRHQLAAAPFGPGGEMEIVDVLTPHIGGVAEFFRLEGDELKVVAAVSGFRSHSIGSRNLDMGLAGDFDGDGVVELAVPTQDLPRLGYIRRTQDGAEVAWSMPIGGTAATNIAAATGEDGRLALGIGREDNVLRVWTSP